MPGSAALKGNSWFKEIVERVSAPKYDWPEEVFAVNFSRRETLSRVWRRGLAYAAVGFLALNVIAVFYFVFEGIGAHIEIGRVRSSIEKMLPSSSAVAQIKTEADILYGEASEQLNRLNFILSLKKQRFPASQKLAGLTRTLPLRTWITKIETDSTRRSVSIEALYLVNAEDPYYLPTNDWVVELKKDPDFGFGLKNIDITRSAQKEMGGSQVYAFSILSTWNEGQEAPKS